MVGNRGNHHLKDWKMSRIGVFAFFSRVTGNFVEILEVIDRSFNNHSKFFILNLTQLGLVLGLDQTSNFS